LVIPSVSGEVGFEEGAHLGDGNFVEQAQAVGSAQATKVIIISLFVTPN